MTPLHASTVADMVVLTVLINPQTKAVRRVRSILLNPMRYAMPALHRVVNLVIWNLLILQQFQIHPLQRKLLLLTMVLLLCPPILWSCQMMLKTPSIKNSKQHLFSVKWLLPKELLLFLKFQPQSPFLRKQQIHLPMKWFYQLPKLIISMKMRM